MKTQFHIRGLNFSVDSRHSLEQSLGRLQSLISITAAVVVLEHHRNGAPAFRAYVSLAVPGPDIHAEAREYTLEAVWLKVTKALRKQIEQRKARQEGRSASGIQSRNGPKTKRGIPRMARKTPFSAALSK